MNNRAAVANELGINGFLFGFFRFIVGAIANCLNVSSSGSFEPTAIAAISADERVAINQVGGMAAVAAAGGAYINLHQGNRDLLIKNALKLLCAHQGPIDNVEQSVADFITYVTEALSNRVCNQGKTQRLVIAVLSGRLAGVNIDAVQVAVSTPQAEAMFFATEVNQNHTTRAALLLAAYAFCGENTGVNQPEFVQKVNAFADQQQLV